MRRRISLLFLAMLLTLPVVVPVSAAEPGPTDAPAPGPSDVLPSTAPAPTPELDPEPTPEPVGSALPTDEPAATDEPTATDEPAATVEPAPDEPSDSAETPAPDPTPVDTTPADPAIPDESRGRPDPTGRYIVILQPGFDTAAVVDRTGNGQGRAVKAERSFGKVVRGFTARLDATQRQALEADPGVVAVVPDEVVELAAQTIPTGVSRIGTKSNGVALINGIDERVDADVAIVDTGIQSNHPDLNVVGGYNCSTTNKAAWRDVQGHGTHVAGTVGALDNTYGAVGVAPGARLWAVKILNDDGYGLLSWYVCGLDWVLAQRDPVDSSRPLFEAVNMSVVKDGKDDKNCGNTNGDVLHKAICRVVKGGIPVVAAAGNDQRNASTRIPAAYSEVITVSALADTDGKAGGLGGNRCYSWGSYDKDDTFADFSNYGTVVDIIAPGKCIWSTKTGSTYGYSSGTSMATPAVAGAVALYKASRPNATPAEVKEALQYLGNTNWFTSTDRDSYHEKLLDVARIGPLGSFSVRAGSTLPIAETGGVVAIPLTLTRSSTFFERVSLRIAQAPEGWSAASSASALGWTANGATVKVTVPAGTPAGRYDVQVSGTNQGRTMTTTAEVVVGLTPFTDIATSSFNADITWLYLEDLTDGCTSTRYCPTANMTRGQMASFLARALQLPAATTDYFTDDTGSTHEADTNRIARAGLTNGCAPGRFCPSGTVTRGQMASFLARALQLPAATTDHFADDTGSTHEADIDRIATAGLTNGCAAGRFCPNTAVDRGQIAAFLFRALKDE